MYAGRVTIRCGMSRRRGSVATATAGRDQEREAHGCDEPLVPWSCVHNVLLLRMSALRTFGAGAPILVHTGCTVQIHTVTSSSSTSMRSVRTCSVRLFVPLRVRPAAWIIFASSIGASQITAQVPAHARASNALVNVAIGGVTGALSATVRHTSVWTGLRRGAVGGLVIAAGKQVVDFRFQSAGFVGRELSGVGISLVAAGGDSAVRYLLPVGPATIVILPDRHVDWRLNVTEAISTVGLMISPNTRLDLSRSLQAGAPVYRDRRWHVGEASKVELAGAEG